MHEDLLGYLLGALEPHEMQRVASWLQSDPEARKQLAEIERALRPLEDDAAAVVEPVPGDLIARTMANIPAIDSDADRHLQHRDPTMASLVPLHPDFESTAPNQSEWAQTAWLDWCAGAVAVAIMLGLLIPSIAAGRLEARKTACQDRLRELGIALTEFVNRDRQHRLPAVAASGPEAFAGVYAVRLQDAGLLPDADMRWCPSLPMPGSEVGSDANVRSVTMTPFEPIPSVDNLYQVTVDRLRQIQQIAGGHYAYTLGVLDQYERLKSPRFEARASFAVMSDAPPAGFHQRQDIQRFLGHGSEGINVMFEDGRVDFIRIPTLNALPDHPLLNNRGLTEAGVHIDDASLAPSWGAPFIDAVQR